MKKMIIIAGALLFGLQSLGGDVDLPIIEKAIGGEASSVS